VVGYFTSSSTQIRVKDNDHFGLYEHKEVFLSCQSMIQYWLTNCFSFDGSLDDQDGMWLTFQISEVPVHTESDLGKLRLGRVCALTEIEIGSLLFLSIFYLDYEWPRNVQNTRLGGSQISNEINRSNIYYICCEVSVSGNKVVWMSLNTITKIWTTLFTEPHQW